MPELVLIPDHPVAFYLAPKEVVMSKNAFKIMQTKDGHFVLLNYNRQDESHTEEYRSHELNKVVERLLDVTQYDHAPADSPRDYAQVLEGMKTFEVTVGGVPFVGLPLRIVVDPNECAIRAVINGFSLPTRGFGGLKRSSEELTWAAASSISTANCSGWPACRPGLTKTGR